MLSFAGIGLVPFLTEAPRLIEAGVEAFSGSGGGVGGNVPRPSGGSD